MEALTIQETARRLKVHGATVRRWIKGGQIAAVKIGARTVRVPESEVARLLAGGN